MRYKIVLKGHYNSLIPLYTIFENMRKNMSKIPEDYNCKDHEIEFIDMVKSGVIERLKNYEGQEKKLSELGFDLTEIENLNGSWYNNPFKAEQELSWFFSVYEKYQEWWMVNYEETLNTNNDENCCFETERVHCCMMIDAYRNVFERSLMTLKEYDCDQTVVIDEKFINEMTKTINENINEIEDIF